MTAEDVIFGLILGLFVGTVIGIVATLVLVAEPWRRRADASRSRLFRNQVRAATRAMTDEHPTFAMTAPKRPW